MAKDAKKVTKKVAKKVAKKAIKKTIKKIVKKVVKKPVGLRKRRVQRWLRNTENGTIHPWTRILSKHANMRECDNEEMEFYEKRAEKLRKKNIADKRAETQAEIDEFEEVEVEVEVEVDEDGNEIEEVEVKVDDDGEEVDADATGDLYDPSAWGVDIDDTEELVAFADSQGIDRSLLEELSEEQSGQPDPLEVEAQTMVSIIQMALAEGV